MARPTLMRHRKFLRLVALCGNAPALARGTLELLWDAGYESGDARVGDAASVEMLIAWKGRRGAGVAALSAAGFLDRLGEDDYAIHDLMDHAPDYVRKRAAREQKRRRNPVDSGGRTADGGRQTADIDRSVTAEIGSATPVGGDTPARAPALARARAPRSSSDPSRTQDDASPHEQLMDAYRTSWRQTYGHDCSLIVKPLDFSALSQHVDAHPLPQLLASIQAYFAADDDYVRRAKHPLALWLRDPLKYLATAAAPKKPSEAPVVPLLDVAAMKRQHAESVK